MRKGRHSCRTLAYEGRLLFDATAEEGGIHFHTRDVQSDDHSARCRYDNLAGAALWAQDTLATHAKDPREYTSLKTACGIRSDQRKLLMLQN